MAWQLPSKATCLQRYQTRASSLRLIHSNLLLGWTSAGYKRLVFYSYRSWRRNQWCNQCPSSCCRCWRGRCNILWCYQPFLLLVLRTMSQTSFFLCDTLFHTLLSIVPLFRAVFFIENFYSSGDYPMRPFLLSKFTILDSRRGSTRHMQAYTLYNWVSFWPRHFAIIIERPSHGIPRPALSTSFRTVFSQQMEGS